jgi:hypothetical protein
MDDYETCLKSRWYDLKDLPDLTVEQIKDYDNDCIRMYLFCYYNYPEFYNYKKKKLLNRYININKDNLIIFAAWCGHLDILKYLISSGLNINYKNKYNCTAYMYSAFNNKIESMKYLETKKINIYQRTDWLKNIRDYINIEINVYTFTHIINKIKYIGHSEICSICYECKDYQFIVCKNNHIVHLECQKKRDRFRCLMCSSKYLI